MENSSQGPTSFSTQANALLRKNLTFQKHNLKANIALVTYPIFLCLLLVLIQTAVNYELDKDTKNKCGCTCVDRNGDGRCEKVCGIEYSSLDQAGSCPLPSPPRFPALLQVPGPKFRAVGTGFMPFTDLPDESCRDTGSCPAIILLTGRNRSLGEGLAGNLFTSDFSADSFDGLKSFTNFLTGSDANTKSANFEPAFFSHHPIYILQSQCVPNATFSSPIQISPFTVQQEIICLQGSYLWRDNSSVVNDELFKGYLKGNQERKINEIIAAYDILNSNESIFNVSIWYNSTYENNTGNNPLGFLRVPRSVNVISNAYLQLLRGAGVKMVLDFIKEMPSYGTQRRLDFSYLLGPLFFTWIILQLFPVMLTALVYEKQQNLRIMMKMHGLGDGPFWMISYAYFLSLSVIYILSFVVFASVIGLKFITLNDYGIQFLFYFICVNLQISLAFLAATMFSNMKTAAVVGQICVLGSGLLGFSLFQPFVEDTSFPRGWIIVMEIFPGFSLYRVLYELGQYSLTGNAMGIDGIRWKDFNDRTNGMREVLIILFVEWLIVLPVAYYFDQVVSLGSGVRKHPLFLLRNFRKKSLPSFRRPSFRRHRSNVYMQMDKPDVLQERKNVVRFLHESSGSHVIICDNLKKVYPGKDGNPMKIAVRGLSLALPRGECFGMLGPNGSGKTTFINMVTGLIMPTSGTAFVQGLDIHTDMDSIYASMGVCPQHDLLWEPLTGREHLLFYGRLKNLKGASLTQAVEESLKSVKLSGVADKQAAKYSGGMKRRLSVAISLIGDPKVVFMDEPSTGLDPASRQDLWNVVTRAKQDRAIFVTTHSMEEAEVLCDRLGIFVDGSFQCIGNPKELKARYGGFYVFTITTSSTSGQEEEVEHLVRGISPNAKKIYHLSGTQKFEMPKEEVRIEDVFGAIEEAKKKFTIHAWGLTDTTLEDVFIKMVAGLELQYSIHTQRDTMKEGILSMLAKEYRVRISNFLLVKENILIFQHEMLILCFMSLSKISTVNYSTLRPLSSLYIPSFCCCLGPM